MGCYIIPVLQTCILVLFAHQLWDKQTAQQDFCLTTLTSRLTATVDVSTFPLTGNALLVSFLEDIYHIAVIFGQLPSLPR